MVSTTLLAVASALAGSAITGLVSYYNTKIRIQSENEQRITDHYLEKKVMMLIELHEAAYKASDFLTGYHTKVLDSEKRTLYIPSEEQIEEAEDILGEYQVAFRRAQPFLTNEESWQVHECIMISYNLLYQIEAAEKEDNTDKVKVFDQYIEKANKAESVIDKKITEPLDKIDKDTRFES